MASILQGSKIQPRYFLQYLPQILLLRLFHLWQQKKWVMVDFKSER